MPIGPRIQVFSLLRRKPTMLESDFYATDPIERNESVIISSPNHPGEFSVEVVDWIDRTGQHYRGSRTYVGADIHDCFDLAKGEGVYPTRARLAA